MRTTLAERACAAAIAGLLMIATAVGAARSRPATEAASEAEASKPAPAAVPKASVKDGKVEVDERRPLDGFDLPPDTDVYAVRLGRDATPSAVVEAGDGGPASGFWPASSIKVLAAVAALEFAGSLGFSGEATVSFDTGIAATLRDLYDGAIRESSNEDYDLLVQIAGLDRLNDEFLTPANGFPKTVITLGYGGYDVARSPAMTFKEGPRSVEVPAREAVGDYGCAEGNCSTLFELVESVRRVLLDDDVPSSQRFALAPADLRELRDALLGADSFFGAAATAALGPGARVYSKPGFAPGRDCVDVAFIEDGGQRFLLGVATPDPDDGSECQTLSTVAYGVLRFLHPG